MSRRLGIAAILAVALLACNRDPQREPLDASDQRLVDALVAEYKAELLAIATADSAALARPRSPQLQERLDQLGLSPARGARVLLAVHDSLARFRDTLLAAAQGQASGN
jgi:hypothetical protein